MNDLPLSEVYRLLEPGLVVLLATAPKDGAILALELAPKVVAIGNFSGRDVNKFKRFGLTPAPAKRVTPPLIAE